MAQDNDDLLSFLDDTLSSTNAKHLPIFLSSTVEVELPSENNDFRARFFNGPRNRAANFHNIPRGGNTNDIVSLTSDEEAQQEYVQGIIVVALVMVLIYIIWAVLLLLLRAGRIGEGRCCCNCCIKCVESFRAQGGCMSRALCGFISGRTPKRPTKASLKRDKSYKENGLVQAASSAVSKVAKSSTSAVSNAAKNVVASSSASGKKNEEEVVVKEKEEGGEDDIIKEPLEEQAPATKGDEEEHEEEQQQHEESEPTAEKVPSPDDDDDYDEEEQHQHNESNESILIDDDDDDDDIDDEYLSKRVKETERTMLVIRCFFLFSGLIVIASCISLSLLGFHAINQLLGTSQNTLGTFESYFDNIVNECDKYLDKSNELDANTDAFLDSIISGGGEKQQNKNNNTDDNNSTNIIGGGGEGLCPNANFGDDGDGYGTIDIEINLGQLFDGPLIKLAEVVDDVTGNVKSIKVVSFLDQTILGTALHLDFEDLEQLVEELIPDEMIPGDILSDVADTIPDVQVPSLPGDNVSVPDLLPGNLSASPGNRMMQTEEEEDIFSVGNDLASFTIIANVSAYENRDLSALLQTNFSFTIDFAEIAELINSTIAAYRTNYLADQVSALRKVSQNQLDSIRSMDKELADILPYWYIAVAFATLLICFVVFMMVGCILAWMNKQPRIYRNVNDACILPLFIFVGLVTWIFTCVFLCLGIISGDLCVNTPDEQLNGMLENTLKDYDPIVYNFAYYYLNGCNPDDRPLVIDLIYVALAETKKAMDDFFNMMSNLGPGLLGKACGNDMNALRTLSYIVSVRVDISIGIIVTVGKAILCESFHPLYALLMYDIMCTDVIHIAGPMFMSLFLISIFSMIMVTLRVAWHELEDDLGGQEEEEKKNVCSGCCRGSRNIDIPEDLCLQEENNQETAYVVHDDSGPADLPTISVDAKAQKAEEGNGEEKRDESVSDPPA